MLFTDLKPWVMHTRYCSIWDTGDFIKYSHVKCNCGLDNILFEIETRIDILKENEYRAFIEEEHAKQHSL